MDLNTHHHALRIDAGTQERRFPSVHILLTLAGQLQLTVVLIHVPIRCIRLVFKGFTGLKKTPVEIVNADLSVIHSSMQCIMTSDLCSVLNRAKICLLDMKPFSTSLNFRLSTCSMYFFSFSCRGQNRVH